MPTAIHERVRQANSGSLDNAIIRLKSGWVVLAETQPVDGYCLLFSDPVVVDLNSLSEVARTQYCLDMIRIGDALLRLTGAYRINYETWGNQDPALHTHVVPRFKSEPDEKRVLPVCKAYDLKGSRQFDLARDGGFIMKMRELLGPFSEVAHR